MNMLSFVPEYEKKTGEKLNRDVLRYVEKLNKIGQNFEKKGREDAADGLPVPYDDVFQTWGRKVFDDDPDMAESIGELMRLCYMEGYEAVTCS